jgi:hypothetical protein
VNLIYSKSAADIYKRGAIQIMYFLIFAQAGIGKIAAVGVPDWFQKQFAGTFLNAFPGALALQYYGIASLELLVATGFLLSLARGEFITARVPKIMKLSLLGSSLVFLILSFGLRLTGDFSTASQVFIYFIASLALNEYLTHANKEIK